jgi:multiple sugar transport system permease protein
MADTDSRSESSRGLIWTCVAVTYAAIVLFPIFWMATMMVKPNDAMFARPTQWLFTPTLEHFDYVLSHGFHWSLLTSFVLCLVSTVLVIVIGTPAAYAFARFEMKLKDDLFLFILATRMAPPVCLVIPFYFLFARLDLLDTFT